MNVQTTSWYSFCTACTLLVEDDAGLTDKLKEFIRWAFETAIEGCDLDGGAIQDKMEVLGLLEKGPVPEDHEYYGEAEYLYYLIPALRSGDGRG